MLKDKSLLLMLRPRNLTSWSGSPELLAWLKVQPHQAKSLNARLLCSCASYSEVVYVDQTSDTLAPKPSHERGQQAGKDVDCIYYVQHQHPLRPEGD